MPSRLRRLGDWLVGSDPGLTRLRMGVDALLSIGLAILLEWIFVERTGALQTPTINVAAAASNHDLLVVAMTIGAIVANVGTLSVTDSSAGARTVSLLIIPLPLVASLAFGLALGADRGLVLSSFGVLLGLAGLARRWGPRGVATGVPLFIGDFYGYFLHRTIPVSDIGWLGAEAAIGAMACVVIRVLVVRPDPSAALRRGQRSWRARARAVARAALEQFDDATPDGRRRAAARLDRRLARLGESSLMIDAQLAEPGAAPPGSSARRLHERLFEAELGITNTARFAAALADDAELDGSTRAAVGAALQAVAVDDAHGAGEMGHAILDELGRTAADMTAMDTAAPSWRRRVLLHRFASSVALVGEALGEWSQLADRSGPEEFTPAVELFGGWLPGTAEVSNVASTRPSGRWYERVSLPRYVRTAIQMAVAVGGATAAGVAFDPARFYWAVIAVFVTFTGANTSWEQVRKAALRVFGTLVGIIVGSLIASAAGTAVGADVTVILVFLFIGVYLFRVNYAFFVVGLTVMLTMLYEQLHEYSTALLVARLEETAIGAGVAALVSLLVLPLRTGRVLDVALDTQLEAVRDVVDAATGGLGLCADRATLADAVRRVDTAFEAVSTTAAALRRVGASGRRAQRAAGAAGALRHYCRNLADDVPNAGSFEDPPASFERATTLLCANIDAVLSANPRRAYVRAASAWSVVEQSALDRLRRAVVEEGHLAGDAVAVALSARDFQLLDGALAALAALRGLAVVAVDTPSAAQAAGDSVARAHG